MVGRGVLVAGLLLASTALAAPGAAPISDTCQAPIGQDDADSGDDAGASPETAALLPDERRYGGTIGAPTASGVDTQDRYQATWSGEGPWTVMVDVRLPDPGGWYLTDPLPSPPLELAAYAPDAEEPTETATMDEDGNVELEFVTTQDGTWNFEVRLVEDADTGACVPTSAGVQATDANYRLYWGCHPHCVQMG